MKDNDPDVASGRPNGHDRALAAELAKRSQELAHSDAIRQAVTSSATELLRSLDSDRSISKVLALIGRATDVCRIYVLEHSLAPGGHTVLSQRYGWGAPDVAPAHQPHGFSQAVFNITSGNSLSALARGDPQVIVTQDIEEPSRGLLATLGVRSVAIVPIFVDGNWWGYLSFADCKTERAWSAVDIDTLKTVAELIAAAITRAQDIKELSDASRVIENSSAVLYRLGPEKPHPLIYVSRNVSHYGYSASELLSSPTRYLDLVHPNDLPDVMVDLGRIADGRNTEVSRERRICTAAGQYVWVEDRTCALYDENHRLTAIEGVLIDINERKTAEAQIAQFSLSDPITGLASRKAFMDALGHAFAAAQRGASAIAIHYLDLDHFKDVNDVLGHSKGDELLKHVAQRLNAVRRSSDLVARFGGDEFAILQFDLSDPSDAGALAARVLHDLAEPYDLGTQIHVTASIGIAVFVHDVAGPEEMVKRADMALYRAKDLGRNQYHFHSEELDVAVIERVTLAGDLRRATDRGELEMYYQPQIDVRSGRIIGLEALVRWNHPKQGLLCPTRFIPIAEQSGTILALGRWVIETVCRQIAAWRAQQLLPPIVAINVSAAQLKATPEFDRELSQTLHDWKLEPSAIELELTESVLMETTRKHGEVIDRLRALGVSIAIDDFGTGYSSLGYLRAYRVNHIKIAQEFIDNLEADSGDAAIVRAALSLARELGIPVIAEGVETKYQLDFLTEAGCRYIQGFYFGRPVPADKIAQLLRLGKIQPDAPASARGSLH
jgi:diguanylate cyclase (GGDEF)-like protein/PAS domain S-box-containing protein